MFGLLREAEWRTLAAAADRLLREPRPISPIVLPLAQELSRAFGARSQPAIRAALAALRGDGPITQGDIDRALAAAGREAGAAWTPAVEQDTRRALVLAYKLGREETLRPSRIKPQFNLVDRASADWLRDDGMFWIRESWDRTLGARIAARAKRDIVEAGLGRVEAAERLGALLGGTFDESGAYWRVVAAAAGNRGRNFGAVEAMVQARATRYEWIAMGDDRACPGCMRLNGESWNVADAVDMRDRFHAAADPDAAKAVHPWMSVKELVDLSPRDLRRGNFMPPIHGNCRCVIVAREYGGGPSKLPTDPEERSRRAMTAIGITAGLTAVVVAAIAVRALARPNAELTAAAAALNLASSAAKILLLRKLAPAATGTSLGTCIPHTAANVVIFGEVLKAAKKVPATIPAPLPALPEALPWAA